MLFIEVLALLAIEASQNNVTGQEANPVVQISVVSFSLLEVYYNLNNYSMLL